jgi:hypothetical protein
MPHCSYTVHQLVDFPDNRTYGLCLPVNWHASVNRTSVASLQPLLSSLMLLGRREAVAVYGIAASLENKYISRPNNYISRSERKSDFAAAGAGASRTAKHSIEVNDGGSITESGPELFGIGSDASTPYRSQSARDRAPSRWTAAPLKRWNLLRGDQSPASAIAPAGADVTNCFNPAPERALSADR